LVWAMWRPVRRAQRDEIRTRDRLMELAAENESLKNAVGASGVFEAIVENSSDFIAMADPEGRITYLNPAGRAMIGLTEDYSLENTRVLDYYPASERLFASNVILRSMAERGRWTGETSLRHWKTAQSITVFDDHFIVRDKATGHIVGLGSIARDVSA